MLSKKQIKTFFIMKKLLNKKITLIKKLMHQNIVIYIYGKSNVTYIYKNTFSNDLGIDIIIGVDKNYVNPYEDGDKRNFFLCFICKWK